MFLQIHDFISGPGDILNVHIPNDTITKDSFKVVWGVEGQSRKVLATLQSESHNESEEIFKEVVENDTEKVFKGLKENMKYTVKLESLGSDALSPAGGQDSKGTGTLITHEPAAYEPIAKTQNMQCIDNIATGSEKADTDATTEVPKAAISSPDMTEKSGPTATYLVEKMVDMTAVTDGGRVKGKSEMGENSTSDKNLSEESQTQINKSHAYRVEANENVLKKEEERTIGPEDLLVRKSHSPTMPDAQMLKTDSTREKTSITSAIFDSQTTTDSRGQAIEALKA